MNSSQVTQYAPHLKVISLKLRTSWVIKFQIVEIHYNYMLKATVIQLITSLQSGK